MKKPISKRPKHSGRQTIPAYLVLLGLLSLSPSALKAETVRLQLKWEHQFQFAGYYAAQEQGYYKAAGLKVEILPSRPGEDPIQQVIQGNAEFGVGTTDLLRLREQGTPVVALAVIFQHSPLALMALEQDRVQSIHDLAEHQVMMEPGSAELQAYLNKEGVTSDKFTLTHHQFNTDALLNGTVKAMSVYVTDEPFALKEAQKDYVLYSPRAVGIDFYGDTLFTTEQQLNQHPETVKAFREASLKGWDYAMRHPEELAQLIHSRYSQRHSLEHLRFEAAQMAPLMQIDLVEIGHMNPGRWRHIADTYAELGLMKSSFDFAGFLYNPHPPPPDLSHLYRIIGSTAVAALFILALAFYISQVNRRLRRHITEIDAAEKALAASEMQFRSTVNDLQVGIVVHAPDSSILLSNPAASRILGLSDKQIANKTATDLTWKFIRDDGSEMPSSEFPVSRVISSGQNLSNQSIGIIKPDHPDTTWIRASTVPVFSDNNELLRIIVNFIDVTEQRNAELNLQAQNKELERFNKMAIGRELRMIELKKEINTLCNQLGRDIQYPLQPSNHDSAGVKS